MIKPCKCKVQPSSETAAHIRPDERYMFTDNAAKLRWGPHALMVRELVLIQKNVRKVPLKERVTKILKWKG